MKTRELEAAIYRALAGTGIYLCFEVMMPGQYKNGYRAGVNLERVDLLSYSTNGTWRFYELKVSKSDFYSKSALTFKGHLNYFVMPHELYEQVKNDIPRNIGVWTAKLYTVTGDYYCECVKKPKRQPLGVDEEKLKYAFMQALSREYRKYRRLLVKTERSPSE